MTTTEIGKQIRELHGDQGIGELKTRLDSLEDDVEDLTGFLTELLQEDRLDRPVSARRLVKKGKWNLIVGVLRRETPLYWAIETNPETPKLHRIFTIKKSEWKLEYLDYLEKET